MKMLLKEVTTRDIVAMHIQPQLVDKVAQLSKETSLWDKEKGNLMLIVDNREVSAIIRIIALEITVRIV